MARITIDGTELQVPDDRSVLEGALRSGIYIPHLCHHPDLPENGSCRICIVEVAGRDQVEASCMLRPEDGMQIKTDSERVRRLRTLALELILSGHPEDCSTCPKYGACELQTLIQYLGGAGSRMRRRARGFRTIDENPLITHDMNRCVLCGRCVRACADLRGVGVLEYMRRDAEFYIGTLHEKLLADTDCRFCQACVEVCPTGTIRDRLKQGEELKTREEAVLPCRAACPAHTDIPRYIRLVKEGNCDEAAAVIREKIPFPKILGHVCNHACEMHCKRKDLNEAMSIRNIKRFAAEADTGAVWRGKGLQLPDTGKRVCVMGGGPAGMTAAYYLRKKGHAVTVKEALPFLGGMLRFGIPEYRLSREIVDEEFQVVEDAGVKVELNTRVRDVSKLKGAYDAVLLAIGTHEGVRLPIEGSKLSGVLLNTDFLRCTSLHLETGIGERVVVLGGGNVAFDCARTAKRLGAKEVALACLEAREDMLADEDEIVQALEEGIALYPARTFERITGTEHADGVDLMEVLSFTFDENRRAVITKRERSEHHLEADTVIFSVGQRPDVAGVAGIPADRGNRILVKDDTQETKTPGIFAAGDAVYGTKSVIDAIASGRGAAGSIDWFLGGDGIIDEVLAPPAARPARIGRIEGFVRQRRVKERVASADDRKDNFDQIDFGICDEDICREAGRCLQCDLRLTITPSRPWDSFGVEEQTR